MSTEIICDQCGRREEPGLAAFEWWEVSNQGQSAQYDFCSERCIVDFFRLRPCTAPEQGKQTAARRASVRAGR